MRNIILNNVEKLEAQMIEAIKTSVSFKSVLDEENAVEGAPFGKEINDCLDSMLSLCKELGFNVYKDKEGYYGYAEIGQGEELVGVLGHLDVVPAGDLKAWNTNPFEATVVDGKLYGRGTQDDKGAMISCLFAVKALIDSGVELNKRIRFIFGTDEENLWRDIARYKENNEEIPSMGITPDNEFFCINAEKGLLKATLKCKKSSDLILKAGNAFNSVPDKAIYECGTCDLNNLKYMLEKLKYEYVLEGNKICVIGKSVHSANSDEGINAISRLAIALRKIGYKSNAIKFIADVIGEDANANNILANCEDMSGKLTFNIGKIDLNTEEEIISIDIRIPVTYKKEDIVNPLVKMAERYGLKYEEFSWLDSSYVPAEHFLIQTLKEVYERETGEIAVPKSAGGATYARAFDNCVAYGMVFPHADKTEHKANECIALEDLRKATELYAISLYELTK